MSKVVADDHFIAEVKRYYNHLGMFIEHRIPAFGNKPTEFHEFVGHGGMPYQDETGQRNTLPFEFAIPALNIKHAFLIFRIHCDAKAKEVQAEIRQAQLDQQAPIILTPDGA